MPKLAPLLIAAAVGSVLALYYFAGLWWTVRRLPSSRNPWRLYFGSLLLRLSVVLLAFYFALTYFDWQQLIAAMVAFMIVRLLLIRILGRGESRLPTKGEAA